MSISNNNAMTSAILRSVRTLAAIVLLPLAAGCGNCGDDADCDAGDFCVNMGCVDCRDNTDCPEERPLCVDAFCVECIDSTDCDDDDACTTDNCDDGGGCWSEAITCDDGVACTDDTCDGTTGCVFVEIDCDPCVDGDSCDDGDSCTEDDTCDVDGVCAGTPVQCSDGQSCDPGTGDCVGGDTAPAPTLDNALGTYTGTDVCGDPDDQVTFGLDAGTFFGTGFKDGEDRTFFLDEPEPIGSTATATDQELFGTFGNTLTLSNLPDPGELTLVITGPDLQCDVILIKIPN